jgi:hypothetical protein
MSHDGATVVPTVDRAGECMGRWKHRPMWHGDSTVRCSTCGEITELQLGRGLGSNAAETRPSDQDIVAGLAKQFDCPTPVAESWLNQMFADRTREFVKRDQQTNQPSMLGWLSRTSRL